ncbi:hypothetical protein [Scopulibacillus cellulosilyticus]|uniref:Mg chelatase-related protein C-terminal domain-containing protein n=1 Tax=Scopulibacillus cellulosilyticus TaxID=2665665 RepID=A0ABW2PVV6_9BACL
MTPYLIKKYCQLNTGIEELLKKAYKLYNYSGRTIHKFIKIARTFADLDGAYDIRKQDMVASLLSRDLDKEHKEMTYL